MPLRYKALPPQLTRERRNFATQPTQPPPKLDQSASEPAKSKEPEVKEQSSELMSAFRGLPRGLKIVLILFFAAAGTVETAFWLGAGWRKWKSWTDKGEAVSEE